VSWTSGGGSWRDGGFGTMSRVSGGCARGWYGSSSGWVAVERPDGLLIERLLDAGLAVIALHPNQVKGMRPRYSVASGKERWLSQLRAGRIGPDRQSPLPRARAR
jgi:hypothetical protein